MRHNLNPPAALAGTRVLVTRPADPSDSLTRLLAELGADVVHQPVIRISEPEDWTPVDAVLRRLDDFDWLAFSSANGVRYLVQRMGAHAHRLGRLKLAAIGAGTADELARWGLKADLVPAEFRAESLATALLVAAPKARFLLARANRGREVLAERLVAGGATVEQMVVYTSSDVETPDPQIAGKLAAGQIDWVTVTSSAIARNLTRVFGAALRQSRLASISPITSESLRALGHEPAVEAARYTMEGLVEAIVAAGRV